MKTLGDAMWVWVRESGDETPWSEETLYTPPTIITGDTPLVDTTAGNDSTLHITLVTNGYDTPTALQLKDLTVDAWHCGSSDPAYQELPAFLGTAELSPDIVDFGYAAPGTTEGRWLTVTNTGTGLASGWVQVSPPFSVVGSNIYRVEAQESTRVTLRFEPDTADETYDEEILVIGASVEEVRAVGHTMASDPAIVSGVRINELVPWNTSGWRDTQGDYLDWIELYNTNDVATNLQNWQLTNGATACYLPDITLAPQGYLIVYATTDMLGSLGEIRVGFELDEVNGGYVALHAPDGTLVSSVAYPGCDEPNWSYSCSGDSSGEKTAELTWGFSFPSTPAKSNEDTELGALIANYAPIPYSLGVYMKWSEARSCLRLAGENITTLGWKEGEVQMKEITVYDRLGNPSTIKVRTVPRDWPLADVALDTFWLNRHLMKRYKMFIYYGHGNYPDDEPSAHIRVYEPLGEEENPLAKWLKGDNLKNAAHFRGTSFQMAYLNACMVGKDSQLREAIKADLLIAWDNELSVIQANYFDKRFWEIVTTTCGGASAAGYQAYVESDGRYWWHYALLPGAPGAPKLVVESEDSEAASFLPVPVECNP